MSSALRSISRSAFTVSRSIKSFTTVRPFHTPFAAFESAASPSPSRSSLTSSPIYYKHSEFLSEPTTSHSGARTYMVSEPDASSKFYEVPSGAYPVSEPYADANGAHSGSSSA